jgi:hypothetical protein
MRDAWEEHEDDPGPEPVCIPIRKVDSVRHAYLGLEGTILLFGQSQGGPALLAGRL